MGLIKAESSPDAIVRFQWRDIEADAKKITAAAERRADALVTEARESAESLRESARAKGFGRGHDEGVLQGREEGLRSAVEHYSQQMELTIAALHEAVGEAVAAKSKADSDSVADMVELAIAIARRVIKRQAEIDPRVLADNLRDALGLAGRQRQFRIAIHPSQRQVLSAALPQLEMEWPALGAAQIVEDASLAPGGCRVFTDHGQIDADLNAQLDRVVADLMPPRSKGEAA